MQESQDRELLRQFVRENSDEAFATLVSRHVNLVYSAALRKTGNPAAAEEVTQAVFVILAKKANRLLRHTAVSGWLYQAARLTAANFLRTEIRRARREQEAYMQSLSNQTEPEIWPEIMPLLEDAMGRIGEKDRNALALRFFEGKSFQEIGAAFGVSENAARKRTNHALEKLRAYFSQCGVTSTAETIAGAISANSVQAAPVALSKAATAAALAKGAAASTSTLTLVNGTLKFMAFSKAQTAAVTAAVILLTAGGAGFAVPKIVRAIRMDYYPNIQGTWEGIMPLGGLGIQNGQSTETRIVVRLSKGFGRYSANIDALDLGRTNVPVAKVVYDFPNIQLFVYSRRNVVYQGKVNAQAVGMNFNGLSLKRTRMPAPRYTRLEESDFAPRAGSVLQGYWKGGIILNGGRYPTGLGDRQLGNNWDGEPMDSTNTLPLNLKIAEVSDGTYRAELDSPMQGADGQPGSLTFSNGTVKLDIGSNAGRFQGLLSSARDEIRGSWIQGGKSVPAFFQRADYLSEVAPTKAEDFSFTSASDLRGHWKGAWGTTIGTNNITIPIALDIGKLPDGSYLATLANLEQLGNESPISASHFEYSPPNLHMEWKWAGGAYDGKLENGKLAGTWSQGGSGFPLVFERTQH